MKTTFVFALLLLCSGILIFSCKKDNLDKALQEVGNDKEIGIALDSYGETLAKTLSYAFGKKDDRRLMQAIVARCNKLKYHDTEVLLSEVAYDALDEKNTILDKIAENYSELYSFSVPESKLYFEQMIAQFPSMVIAYRSVFEEGASVEDYLNEDHGNMNKVVHVNGLQREGEKLYGFDSLGERVIVKNEVFFAVHLSEIHNIDGTLIAGNQESSNNNGNSLGGITTRSSTIFIENQCSLPNVVEPQNCQDPVVTNFAAEVMQGYVELSWESNNMPISKWNKFYIERKDINGGAVDYTYVINSCGGPNFTMIPPGPYLPNTNYQFRIWARSMSKNGFCDIQPSNWVTIETDESFLVSPPDDFIIDNDKSGELQFRWSPPSPNGQSVAYRIEYMTADLSNWQELVTIDPQVDPQFADLNGNPITSYLWSHPQSMLGNKVLFRILNKWQGTWSILGFNNFHYPAFRDSGESSFIHRIKIGDLSILETPEMGLPELQLVYGTAADFGETDAPVDASSGAPVRFVPCERQLYYADIRGQIHVYFVNTLKNGWFYPNGVYNVCGENWESYIEHDHAPPEPDPQDYEGQDYYYYTTTGYVKTYQPVTAMLEWADEDYNRDLEINIHEIDGTEERIQSETVTITKKFTSTFKGGASFGKKEGTGANLSGELKYERGTTKEFSILYPGDRISLGELALYYWDEPDKIFYLLGSGDLADIKRLNSPYGVEIIDCDNACTGILTNDDLYAR
jgi:hypothetical protein